MLGPSPRQAQEAEARAQQARAQAERAEAEAHEARTVHQVEEAEHEDRIREADRIDPQVDHKADDYERPPIEQFRYVPDVAAELGTK